MIDGILNSENERGRQKEANYAAERATRKNGSKHANKPANKPANNHSKKPKNNGPKKTANNGPMTWVTYKGKYQKMTLNMAKELGLK